jgi:hypothetical protein
LGPPKADNPNASVEPKEKAAGLLPAFLAAGSGSGYRFRYIPGPVDSNGMIFAYTVHADPIKPAEPNDMHFFTDQSAVIRVEKGKGANQNSPPLQ